MVDKIKSKKKEEPKDDPVLDMRAKSTDQPPGPDEQRFHFFLIDTGWNEAVSKLVNKHFPRLVHNHNPHDQLFVLTPEQSVDIMRHSPREIGNDPIVLVYDLYAPADRKENNYRGFRLCLGLMKHPEQAMSRLQEFFRFIVLHRQSVHLEREVRRELHREGFEGMIKILRESTPEIV